VQVAKNPLEEVKTIQGGFRATGRGGNAHPLRKKMPAMQTLTRRGQGGFEKKQNRLAHLRMPSGQKEGPVVGRENSDQGKASIFAELLKEKKRSASSIERKCLGVLCRLNVRKEKNYTGKNPKKEERDSQMPAIGNLGPFGG